MIRLLIVLCLSAASGNGHAKPNDPFTYLDNGTLRIGVDKSRGAAIGYLALPSYSQ